MELLERPARYVAPNLDPSGVRLKPKELSDGVYALMADKPPRDNSGFVVGKDGVLVIDAGINGAMARHIQEIVHETTGRPILYLANTVYHGDHTFGNYAFPDSTEVIASRKTRESMTDLEAEKRARSESLFGNLDAIADVKEWRLPDVVFDDFTEVDLGGRKVQLWHFGPGNSPGDTVIYVPEARAAWTGNLIGYERALPMLLEDGPVPYLDTLAKFKNTLDVKTIVPGHGPFGSAKSLDRMMEYLRWLAEAVDRASRLGLSVDAAVETVTLLGKFRIPRWNPLSRKFNPLLAHMHRLNVLTACRALKKESAVLSARGSELRLGLEGEPTR